ncbi:hypothetical protein V6N13_138441 [Hibiscus sabdariffa]
MGFTKQDLHFTSPLEGDSDNDFLGQQLPDDNWAERVNSLNSHKPNDDCPITINPKEDTGKSSKKGKRYGSLANLQDKVISSFERKRRDRGWRKIKKGGVDITSSELEGRSLSDSDLRTRRDFQIKEARKTLEVLSWNIRGLGSNLKVSALKKLLNSVRVDVAFIQESKKVFLSVGDVSKLWYDDVFDFRYSEAEGNSGGLISIWNPAVFQLSNCTISKNLILLEGIFIPDGFPCLLANVYAPCIASEQKVMLLENRINFLEQLGDVNNLSVDLLEELKISKLEY